jgi:hypothetical protein
MTTTFIEPTLENILVYLNKLEDQTIPEWGTMSSQRMVEHLSESLSMSIGEGNFNLAIPEEKIQGMQNFLFGEKLMAKNIQVDFAPEHCQLRNESLELAIDEFCEKWVDFESCYDENPNMSAIHPYYGDLDFKGWLRLHSKHFTHHFLQFNLL